MVSAPFLTCEPAALGLLHTGWFQTPYLHLPRTHKGLFCLFVFVASFLESSLTDSSIIIDVQQHYGMLGLELCSLLPI